MTLEAEIARFLNGSAELAPEDVADVTAVLILVSGSPPGTPHEQQILEQFAARANLTADLADEAVGPRVVAYFQGRSSLRVVTALIQLIREDLAGGHAGKDLAAVIGQSPALGAVLGGGQRPAGTVPAGPAARFAVEKKLR